MSLQQDSKFIVEIVNIESARVIKVTRVQSPTQF